ncbi:MAG: hypothetical protein FWG44_05305 [Oscillospiraceae bacterium]|nr:hypothetical protein [Oscillospiraceae bacterium]
MGKATQSYRELFDIAEPTSTEAFADAVYRKAAKTSSKQLKSPQKRALRFAAIAMAAFIALTVTVGAATNWQYSELVNRFFGNNPNVLDNMHEKINYEVTKNTFEGFTFEVSALYADSDTVFVAIDVISEEQVFNTDKETEYYLTVIPRLSDYGFYTSPYVISENHLTAFLNMDTLPESVSVNQNYIFDLTEIYVMVTDENGVVLQKNIAEGKAEIEFTVDKLANENLLTAVPNVTLESGNVLTEVKINPFTIWFSFNGEEEIYQYEKGRIFFKTKDGEITDLTDMTISRVLPEGDFLIPVASRVSKWYKNGEWKISLSVVKYDYGHTFDTKNIEAIIFKGVEIPLN